MDRVILRILGVVQAASLWKLSAVLHNPHRLAAYATIYLNKIAKRLQFFREALILGKNSQLIESDTPLPVEGRRVIMATNNKEFAR
jgi:hypothetical protein